MSWIVYLIIAYLLIALATLVDKFVVSKVQSHPVFYMLLVSTFGLTALVLVPFGFAFNGSSFDIAMTAVAGAFYTLAILFLYTCLQRAEATRVFTLIGGLTSVSTFGLSYLFLGERLVGQQLIAFCLLLIGGLLISWQRTKSATAGFLGMAVLSGLAFGVSYVAAKYAYGTLNFVTGFVLLRVFAFIAAALFLLLPMYRKIIKNNLHQPSGIKKGKTKIIVIAGQACIGVGFLLVNYVISLTSASLVLAGQGMQYAFLFIISIIAWKFLPKQLREEMSGAILVQKIVAIGLIAGGLWLLAV